MMNSIRALCSVAALGVLIAACSPNNPKRSPPPESNPVRVLDPGTLEVTADTKVDILFVVDDSRSMKRHQENLSRNIKQFSNAFAKNALVDFHIGVTTAWDSRLTIDDPSADIKTHNGRIIDMTPLGHLVPLKDAGGKPIEGPRYITKETPNFVQVLEKTLLVGAKPGPDDKAPTIGPFTEEFFKPTFRVFENNSTNAGFYRPEAYLVIFYITDANDESVADEQDKYGVDEFSLYNYLVHVLKKGDHAKVQAYAALAPSGTSCPAEGSGKPIAIEKFLGRFKNRDKRVLNLCSSNFGAKLAEFGRDIVEQIPEKVIELPGVPAFGTIEKPLIKVFYGKTLLRGRPEYPGDKRKVHYIYVSGTQRDGQPSTPHSIVLNTADWDDVEFEKDAKVRVEVVWARPENLKNGRTRVF